MQFLFLEKAAGIAIRMRQIQHYSGMLHDALSWPVAGGYAAGVQFLTVGEGWIATLPQQTDINDFLRNRLAPVPKASQLLPSNFDARDWRVSPF
jgi:hypothetical protein